MTRRFLELPLSLATGPAVPDPLSPIALMSSAVHLVESVFWTVVLSATSAVIYAQLRGLRDRVDARSLAQVFA